MIIRMIICILVFLCTTATIEADIKEELEFIFENSKSVSGFPKEKLEKYSPKEISELKLLPFALIRLYQKYISSQDGPRCIFSPSCSHFAMQSIEECGILQGSLMTIDRLQRCNGFSRMYYDDINKEGWIYDPVKKYILFKKN